LKDDWIGFLYLELMRNSETLSIIENLVILNKTDQISLNYEFVSFKRLDWLH